MEEYLSVCLAQVLLAGGGAAVLFIGAVAPLLFVVLLLLRVDVLPQPAAARHDTKKAQVSEKKGPKTERVRWREGDREREREERDGVCSESNPPINKHETPSCVGVFEQHT